MPLNSLRVGRLLFSWLVVQGFHVGLCVLSVLNWRHVDWLRLLVRGIEKYLCWLRTSVMRQMSEVKCDEACVKNEAFRGCGMRIGAWALGAEAFSSQEVEEE